MIENCLAYIEICMQLYANQNDSQELTEQFNKYRHLFWNEYENLTPEEQEIVEFNIKTKISSLRREREIIMTVEEIMLQDNKLNDLYPRHIRAQYSDKLKKIQKNQHFLETILKSINEKLGFSR